MEDFWKPAIVNLVRRDLLKKASKVLNEVGATYSEEIQAQKRELPETEFLAFLQSEPDRIRANPIWERFQILKSEYGTIGGIVIKEIRDKVEDLQTIPKDATDLVAIFERHPNYVTFLEGLKLERKISVLRDFQPQKVRRKFDPFSDCLKRAIADAANPLVGKSSKIELAGKIASIIEAQANGKFLEYFDSVDIRFERLNKEQERLAYLEEQRKIFRDSPAIEFFDRQLYHVERRLERRDKIARAVGTEIEPTLELLQIWQESERQPAVFVQRVPYLKQMLDGLIEARKLEFVEQELELRKQAQKEAEGEETTLKFTPPLVSDFQQMFESSEFQETIKKAFQKLHEGYQPPFIQGIKSAFEKLKISHRQFGERLVLLGKKWDEVKAQTKKGYEREYISLIHFLKKEGYIIPADYIEFADWYFMIKHGDKSFSDFLNDWPEVSPADFREFHEYKEGVFLQSDEIAIFNQIITRGKPKETEIPVSQQKGNAVVDQPSKRQNPKKRQIPAFEEVIIDPNKLPVLWKRISEMERPIVSESGKYIWSGLRPHAILLAFAQALQSRDKLREGISTESTYLVLCTRFGVKPSPSTRQIKRGKRDYKEHLEAFNDVLREL